jgi:hypothetical protein
VDKTIMEADLDHDGKISFEEFTKMVENTDVSMSMTLGTLHPSFSRVLMPCPKVTEANHLHQTNSRNSDTRRTKFARRF